MRDFSALICAADKSVASAGVENVSTELNLKLKANNEPRRVQVGFFHVWIRGSNRYNVFYETVDFVGFLERCRIAAEKNKTIVSAFVLMDNHVHLQIYTRSLNAFMKSLLMSFNQWYNRRKGLSGQLFNSPFSSKLIENEEYLQYNYLYILTNPVRAGICENISRYRWSSYHFAKNAKNGHYNFLGKFINISSLVPDYLFKSSDDLDKSISNHLKKFWSLEELDSLDDSIDSGEDRMDRKDSINAEDSIDREDIIDREDSSDKKISMSRKDSMDREDSICKIRPKGLIRPTDHEIATNLDFILNGKKMNQISRLELIKIMQILHYQLNATYRQISSVTHESFYDVVRLLR